MRPVNAVILSGSDAANVTGASISTAQVFAASFQIWCSDVAAAGSLVIQASNEIAPENPTKWTQVQTSAVTAGVAAIINIPQMAYKFIRAVYTSTTPGTGTIEVYMAGFGV